MVVCVHVLTLCSVSPHVHVVEVVHAVLYTTVPGGKMLWYNNFVDFHYGASSRIDL